MFEKDPIKLFGDWYNLACDSGKFVYPNSMSLSTVSADHKPSSRIVLLKGHDAEGFYFFTNYDSRKGREVIENTSVALLFYWECLQKQIRVEGEVERISDQDSDDYFATRSELSQLGAWASKQSEVLINREELEERVDAFANRFKNTEITRPSNWGGFLVRPNKIEFWQEGDGRLHDRIIYKKEKFDWSCKLLYP